MRIYNKLIISLVIALSLVNILLASLGQNDISVYFILDSIVYLIITLVYVHLNPRAKSALNTLSAIIFTGFMFIVALKVIEIIK